MGGRGTNGRVSRPTTEYHKTPDLKDYNRTASSRSIDEAAVNTNPNYRKPGTGAKYTSNCQRCGIAYELQRRGYDVEARARVTNGTDPFFDSTYSDPVNRVYYGTDSIITNNKFERPTSSLITSGEKAKSAIENKMQSYGNGSRAEICVTWRNSKYSHIFIAENVDGKIRFIDPQSGSKDVSNYFASGMIMPNKTVMRRLDNAVFSDKIKLAVKNKGSNEE